jgi:hypothetical protein
MERDLAGDSELQLRQVRDGKVAKVRIFFDALG